MTLTQEPCFLRGFAITEELVEPMYCLEESGFLGVLASPNRQVATNSEAMLYARVQGDLVLSLHLL